MWPFKKGNQAPEPEPEPEGPPPTGLNASNFAPPERLQAHVMDWNFFEEENALRWLNRGDVIFNFKTGLGSELTQDERSLISKMINVSGFGDEVTENNVPLYNPFDDKEGALYTVIITKVAYLLNDVPLDILTPHMMTIPSYHQQCQPGKPKIWTDVTEPNTFRMTKTVIPYVYKITVQMRVSEVQDSKDLNSLSSLDEHNPVDKALLIERTKRNPEILDATRKAKSVLLYTQVEGGILVQHYTVVLNVQIPTLAGPIFNNFTSTAAQEGLDTARLTRLAFAKWRKDNFSALRKPE